MITLLNAAPDTGNQGVSALCLSALAGLAARDAGPLAVADHGRGVRQSDMGFANVARVGLTHNRRFWRGDSLATVRAMARIGGGPSASARVIAGSRAILDVSGGDSFTDLYGPRRFRAMVLTKRLALDNGLPLILLPQTLGPFRDPANRAEAVSILAAARAVWLRDAASYHFLQEVLGARFDPDRHRLGLDMAVALPSRVPTGLSPKLKLWLSAARGFPLAGLNVSGLLTQDAVGAQATFGLADRHDHQIEAAARAILDHAPNMRLLLVSHVHRDIGDRESDLAAALALKARLESAYPHFAGAWRVCVNEPGGVIEVTNMMLSGRMGFLMHTKRIDPEGRKVVRAAGELLERYRIARSGGRVAALEQVFGQARDFRGELRPDCG